LHGPYYLSFFFDLAGQLTGCEPGAQVVVEGYFEVCRMSIPQGKAVAKQTSAIDISVQKASALYNEPACLDKKRMVIAGSRGGLALDEN